MTKHDESRRDGAPTALRISVRRSEACRLTGIGRTKLFELIGAGKVDVVKIGSRTLVLTESLRSLLGTARSQH